VLISPFMGWSSSVGSGWRGRSPLVDDACIPIDTPLFDMTLSVIKLRRNFVTDSSTVVSSSDIRALD
jgi:hypothetical protein